MTTSTEREQLLNDLSLLAVSYQTKEEEKQKINRLSLLNQQAVNRHLKMDLIKVLSIAVIITFFIAMFLPFLRSIGNILFCGSLVLLIVSIFSKNPGKLMGVTYKRNKTEQFLKTDKKSVDRIAQINQSQSRIQEIENKVAESGVMNRIPSTYTSYVPIAKMFTYVNNMRADSLKEAINLYEIEAHQSRLESKHDQIISTAEKNLMETRATKAYASAAAVNSASAAHYSKEAAVYSKKAANNSSDAASASKEAASLARSTWNKVNRKK